MVEQTEHFTTSKGEAMCTIARADVLVVDQQALAGAVVARRLGLPHRQTQDVNRFSIVSHVAQYRAAHNGDPRLFRHICMGQCNSLTQQHQRTLVPTTQKLNVA